MYRVSAQDPDDDGAQRSHDVARVFKRTGHGQYPCAQTGLQEMYQGVEVSARNVKRL